jgi:hypothetical protein
MMQLRNCARDRTGDSSGLRGLEDRAAMDFCYRYPLLCGIICGQKGLDARPFPGEAVVGDGFQKNER